MALFDFLKTKKIEDLSRIDLEKLAIENKISFDDKITDEDLQKLVTAAAASETKKPKLTGTTKVKFLLSPTGAFNLAYNVGDEAELDANKAKELIDEKYAVKIK